MRRVLLLGLGVALLVSATPSSPTLRLANRDVHVDPAFPLPAAGAGFYVFGRAAITRAQIARLRGHGLRYLGTVGPYTYAFVRTSKTPGAEAFLRAQPNLTGTALTLPIDRVERDLAKAFRRREAPPMPLVVTFHPHATAAEVRALLGADAEKMRLPRDPNASILEERTAWLSAAGSTKARLLALARSPVVGAVELRYPRHPDNAASRALSNADAIIEAPLDLDGEGVVVGHWDGGAVSASHRDFDGRVENQQGSGSSSHATHTAGTILGSGAGADDARGYAPKARMVAYTYNGDAYAERRAAKHEFYHEHDNHSWSSGQNNHGDYNGGAREYDTDARDILLLPVKSAGNNGRENDMVDEGYGFDSLSANATGKNALVVGATADDGDLARFSARGPTNDGRLKPDLCANGSNLRSTMPGGGYGSMSGTSMSTPSVTGIVALLSQLYKQHNGGRRWAPDMIRAVLLHTVTDVFHPGPDYRFGWGNADAQAAAQLILADAQTPGRILVRGAVRDGETIDYEVPVPAGARELRLTLTWLDAYANSTATRRLLHDLDLEVESPSGQQHFPWTLDPANPFDDAVRTKRNEIDNIEQVLVESPEEGTWKVRVRGRVTDPDLFVQGYVLASSHVVDRSVERMVATVPADGTRIPDGDAAGIELTFEATDRRPARAVRLFLDVAHEERGHVAVDIVHPDGTVVAVETPDTSTRRDIFAVFPDLRSYDGDIAMLFGKPAEGTWTVRVADPTSGISGLLRAATLEIEFEGAPPPPNQPPSADAGKDAEVEEGTTATLDGTRSSDPDGDTLLYTWRQQTGPSATLQNGSDVTATFVAPDVEADTELVFRLLVDDQRGGTSNDDVTITVRAVDPGPPNRDPIARTTDDFEVNPGDQVVLDASGSEDPDGDPLAFSWSQIAGADVALTGAETVAATFVAPDLNGEDLELSFRIEVTDDRGGLDLAEITVVVTEREVAPPPTVRKPFAGVVSGKCVCTGAPAADFGAAWLLLVLFAVRLRRSS